jgi:hypothetical protein
MSKSSSGCATGRRSCRGIAAGGPWLTAVLGTAAHVWIRSQRMFLEETMLHYDPRYRATMAHKPRLVPNRLHRRGRQRAALILAAITVVAPAHVLGEPVSVRHTEGVVHGFLALRTMDGTLLADGDLIQTARGEHVTARLVFRFKDGSIHNETAVFSQERVFRLISDHLVQKGPAFPQPIDMTIDAVKGDVVVRYSDDRGQQKTESEHLDLPPDLSNGLILALLKNVRADAAPHSLSFVAATPKPRLVKLAVAVGGRERFSTGSMARTAMHYILKVDLGGVSGVLAPLLGKQPPDSHVWILGGEAPAFVKSEQPLYIGGPVWRIELISPAWPRARAVKH